MKYILLNYEIKQPYLCEIISDKIAQDIVDKIIDCRGSDVGIVVHISMPHSLFSVFYDIIIKKWAADTELGGILTQHKVDFRIIDIAKLYDGVVIRFENGIKYDIPYPRSR